MNAARVSQVLLVLAMLTFLGTGLAFLLFPKAMLATIDLHAKTPPAVTDIRAVYGGMELGIALFLAFCWLHTGKIRTGLFVAGLVFFGLLFGRLVGFVLDGNLNALSYKLAISEFVGMVLCLWGERLAFRAQKEKEAASL